MSEIEAIKIVDQCVARGADVDEVLRVLQQSGAHPTTATRAIRLRFSLTLGEAVAMLMSHEP